MPFSQEFYDYELLFRLTELSPGAIFHLETYPDGTMKFHFMSEGIKEIHPELDLNELKSNPRLGFSNILDEDLNRTRLAMKTALENNILWESDFRVQHEDGKLAWHRVRARFVSKSDGSVHWFGTFHDISDSKNYIEVLETILHDLSHEIRQPAASIQGLFQLLENETAWGLIPSEIKSALNDSIHNLEEKIQESNARIVSAQKQKGR
jgi:signal transduction histidine kinase